MEKSKQILMWRKHTHSFPIFSWEHIKFIATALASDNSKWFFHPTRVYSRVRCKFFQSLKYIFVHLHNLPFPAVFYVFERNFLLLPFKLLLFFCSSPLISATFSIFRDFIPTIILSAGSLISSNIFKSFQDDITLKSFLLFKFIYLETSILSCTS